MQSPRTRSPQAIAPARPRLRPALLLLGVLAWPPVQAQDDAATIVIATASPAGVYHATGRTLCRLLDVPCEARTSDGSAANLEAVRTGEVTVALAQSDLQHYAVSGTRGFTGAGPDPTLRAVMSLHGEPFTLVARRRSGIQGFADLKGHAVNVGNPGSGQRGTMMTLLEAWGWTLDAFQPAYALPADQQSLELCHGKIDAMVYTVGHPNPSIEQAVRLCDARLVDVTGPAVDHLVAETPYLAHTTIPGGLYADDQPAVETFGVRATLVASADSDPEAVYALVAAVFDDLEAFKSRHPAYADLTPQGMIHEGLSAPLHEGAKRYYRERGWLDNEAAPAQEGDEAQPSGAGDAGDPVASDR
ncbi:TAXI family TRAP transporter solute-binding subunit [Halomonas nitroreducens]|uniref:TAXI family TRAP transporter solute-binding subunit n=1 Tax=Halomonas nitroreducens TaxID=447425 RepID=A0A3S0I544_9GAMM|nr:TAXI family TRAP transporter solute-binding subunit [Halomonas nitroreducens]RTQ98352.1 TAXI family TRAP transporter solute-binding subunit [Halomonas nitroreducens]